MEKSSKNTQLDLQTLLSEIQELMNMGKLGKAEMFLDKLEKELAKTKDTSQLRVDYLAELGKLHFKKGEFKKAKNQLQEALKKGTEYPKSLSYILNYLAAIESSQGNIDQAEMYFLESLKIRRQLNDMIGIGNSLGNLVLIYSTRGDIKKANECAQESIEVLSKVGTKEAKYYLFYTIDNIGEAYRTQGNLLKAEEYYLKALDIAKDIKKKDGRAWGNLHLGVLTWARKDLETAKKHLLISRMMWKNLSVRDNVYVETLTTLAGVHTDLEEFTKAKRILNEAQTVVNEIRSKVSQIHVTYFQGYLIQRQGDVTSAKEYFESSLSNAKAQNVVEYILKSLVALTLSELCDYSSKLQESNLKIAKDYLKQLEVISSEKNLTLHQSEALIIQGKLLRSTMDYQKSLNVFDNALKLAKGHNFSEQVLIIQEEIRRVEKLGESVEDQTLSVAKKKMIKEVIEYLENYQQALRALKT